MKQRISDLLKSKTVEHREIRSDHTICEQKIKLLEEEVRRLRYIEQEHLGCQDRIKYLILMEKEHAGCKSQIDELNSIILRYKREIESSKNIKITQIYIYNRG